MGYLSLAEVFDSRSHLYSSCLFTFIISNEKFKNRQVISDCVNEVNNGYVYIKRKLQLYELYHTF